MTRSQVYNRKHQPDEYRAASALMTSREVCAYLRIERDYLHDLRESGQLKFKRVHKGVSGIRYLRSDVERFEV